MSTDVMDVLVSESGPVGLNSPPDSNPAMRDGGSDSELSDIEPESDNKKIPLVIEPVHWEGGVPVFKPCMDDFVDFERYINAVTPFGMQTGIVKVIPPAEWLAAQPPLDDAIKNVHIKNPIMQEIAGKEGTYRQANMEKGRSYNLPQWRNLCEQSEHQPPAKRGERRINQIPAAKTSGKTRGKAAGPKRRSGRVAKNKDGNDNSDRLPTPVSPKDDDVESVIMDDDEPAPKRRMGGGGRGGKAISVSARRKNNQTQSALVDEAAFENFKYELDEQFSPERCAELERQYWRTLTYAPPLYGGDMPGTLFDDRTKEWNLSDLPNLLNVLGQKIPGVNTAYLYLGMWKATFAWHLEDVDLYSINYLHFGAPKQWYSISQKDARKFEKVMGGIWPIDSKKCDQFLRHKTYLISPATLKSQHGITANKIVHHPGEFIITFPYGYHSGYNLGYNCAEAVNFAVESWLEHARIAKRCECSDADDSVWVDHREIERKLRGEATDDEETDEDEDEEDEEDDVDIEQSGLPSPPGNNGILKPKVVHKKRKRAVTDKGDRTNTKKIRIRVKVPTFEPCILCPNNIPSEPLLETEDGQKVHRICAQYIPETRIESGDKDIVMDLEHIPQARHDLKCNFCRSKKGACFQCSQKKCTRAYHATCAAAAGVFVEEGEVPHFGEDGTEYKKSDFGFSCRFHRSKRDKKLDGDALADDDRILKAAAALKVGTICQLQYHRGDIFAGAIVENRRGEETLLVDVVPRGERVEVEYKWLLLPNASDYHLPKASANAIAMPKSFKDRAKLKTTERQANDAPRADDTFVKGTTWAEFHCGPAPRNKEQIKVNMDKPNQVWYYLGKKSTEAKAQYTHNPAIKVHNAASQFLDTVAPASKVQRGFSYAASYPANALNRPVIRPPVPAYSASPIPAPTPIAAPGSLMKPEKPYQYKPRIPGPGPYTQESYRVDQQAYSSQHNFVQRSAETSAPILPPAKPSLKFNSDPKFQAAARPSNGYSPNTLGQAIPTAARPVDAYANSALKQPPPVANRSVNAYPGAGLNHVSASAARPGNMYSSSPSNQAPNVNRPAHGYPHQAAAGAPRPASSYPNTGMYQAAHANARQANGFPNLQVNQAPSNLSHPSSSYSNKGLGQAPSHGILAPPSSYRPPQASSTMPQAPNNYSSQSMPRPKKAAKEMRTSVFVKYAYLQKEHNRDAGEYKTPYRPGGGFMNGYEGSMKGFEEAARLRIFGPTARNPVARLPPSEQNNAMPSAQNRTSTTPVQGLANTPKPNSAYPFMATPAPTPSPTMSNVSSAHSGQNAWPKKDGPNLHAAIREQYKNAQQVPYQTSQHPQASQFQGPTAQPSPVYHSQSTQQSPGQYMDSPRMDQQGYTASHHSVQNDRAAPQQQMQHASSAQSHSQYASQNLHRPSSQHASPAPYSQTAAPSLHRPTSQSASPALSQSQTATPNQYRPNSQNGQQQHSPASSTQQFPSPPMYNYQTQYSSAAPQATSNYQAGPTYSTGSAYQNGTGPQHQPQQPVSYHQHAMPAQSMAHKQYGPATPQQPSRDQQARQDAHQHTVPRAAPRMQNEPQFASKQHDQMMYPHQQSAQSWNGQPLVAMPGQLCDLIDLPADSSSIIEKVMMNLRKAKGA